MIQFSNAKINIGLYITEKRSDGFHNIESIFYPAFVYDTLEFIESKELSLHIEGITIDGNLDDNIIIKAYHLLKKDFPKLPLLDICLLKKIPTGAGLGGGSSNGAFMLMMLNKQFQLEISKEKMLHYASLLGSDCPFFIINQPCIAKGRGEMLQTISLNLSNYTFVIIHPKIHVNTAWAFSQITPQQPFTSLEKAIQQPIETWKENIHNDFEKPIFNAHPLLSSIKNKLYESGAMYASMSGSGSSIFGIFSKEINKETIQKSFNDFSISIF